MDSEATFSYTDGFVELGAGVVLPTFDVYSDVSLIVLLLSIVPINDNDTWFDYTDYKIQIKSMEISFGKIMMIPLILSTIFILPHWLKFEKSFKNRLMTLPLVLLQLYPQYRSMRVICWAFIKKNTSQCLKEKHDNDCSLSYVGKLLCYL